MNTIIEWISSLLYPIEPVDGLLKMNNLNKCVTMKSYQEINQHYGNNCKLTIMGCEESNIYIDSNIETLLVSACVNCTIFVAAVSKICTIEKCENVNLCIAANQVRIGNCIDSTVYSYTPTLSPIVYGDTRSLRMAPHNASYPNLPEHLKRAYIKFELSLGEKEKHSDWFTEQVSCFSKPILMAQD